MIFYREFDAYDEKAATKHLKSDIAPALMDLRARFAALPEWSSETIHQAVVDVAQLRDMKIGKLAQPLRVALCGTDVSPPIDVTVRLIGRERTLQRMDRALKYKHDYERSHSDEA